MAAKWTLHISLNYIITKRCITRTLRETTAGLGFFGGLLLPIFFLKFVKERINDRNNEKGKEGGHDHPADCGYGHRRP